MPLDFEPLRAQIRRLKDAKNSESVMVIADEMENTVNTMSVAAMSMPAVNNPAVQRPDPPGFQRITESVPGNPITGQGPRFGQPLASNEHIERGEPSASQKLPDSLADQAPQGDNPIDAQGIAKLAADQANVNTLQAPTPPINPQANQSTNLQPVASNPLSSGLQSGIQPMSPAMQQTLQHEAVARQQAAASAAKAPIPPPPPAHSSQPPQTASVQSSEKK